MEGFELVCFILAVSGVVLTGVSLFVRRYNLALTVTLMTCIFTGFGVRESIMKDNAEIREKRQTCEQSGLVYLVSDDVCVDGFRP
jgi:hypothetical protein